MRITMKLMACLETLRSYADSTRFSFGLGLNGYREKRNFDTLEEGIKIVGQQVRQIEAAARRGDCRRILEILNEEFILHVGE